LFFQSLIIATGIFLLLTSYFLLAYSLLLDNCSFSEKCSFKYFIPSNHCHDQDIQPSEWGIDPELKQIILELANQNRFTREYGSTRIISDIRSRYVSSLIHFFTIQPNIPENKIPLKRQISNLLNYTRKKSGVSGNEVDSVEQFITPFLLDPNAIENLNEDDPIVYGHDVKNGRVFIGNGSDDTPTYFAFTTKRLMSVLRTLENDRAESRLPLVLHMDATFKTNDNEFPFMIIGISDNDQKFHPISMIVISHRTEEIHTRVLNDQTKLHVKKAVRYVHFY